MNYGIEQGTDVLVERERELRAWDQSQRPHERNARLITSIAWIAIILGIVLRLVQLPNRELFFDEAVTQIRVAGHTANEMWQTLYDGRQRTALELHGYATVGPTATPATLISSLVREDAQHPPLFYLCEFALVRTFGSGLFVWRILPAVFGLLAIGAAFSLARDLFGSARSGLVAAAVFAVSPIERIYSDQAREYSLLALLTLVSTIALLRSARSMKPQWWLLYCICLLAALYTSPFTGYVLCAHGAFMVATHWNQGRRALGAFALSAGVAIVSYSPWLFEIVTHRKEIAETNAWSSAAWPLTRLGAKWLFNVGSAFFDLEYLDLRWTVLVAVILAVVGYTIYRTFRTLSREARWCLGTLIVVPFLMLALPDIFLKEHRSSVTRYTLPMLAALVILAARAVERRPIAASVVLAGGLLSCIVGAQHATWWDNDSEADVAGITAAVNAVSHAQIVSDINPGSVVTYSRRLNADVRISLIPRQLRQAQINGKEPVFLLSSQPAHVAAFAQQTALDFSPVSLPRARTAHTIGARISGNGNPASDLMELFQSKRAAGVARER